MIKEALHMNKKRAGLLLALLCAGAAIAGVFYFAGFQAARRERPALDAQTFYAAISDIRGIPSPWLAWT